MRNTTRGPSVLDAADALTIAQSDAVKVCRDLTVYQVRIVLEPDGWHVDNELRGSDLKGDGLHYVLDAVTAAIVTKRYEQ